MKSLPLLLLCAVTFAARADICVQPYLQNPRPGEMTIMWWTDEQYITNVVQYGIGEATETMIASHAHVPVMEIFLSSATVTGLTEGATYVYRVRSGRYVSQEYSYRSPEGMPDRIRVLFYGDGRTDTDKIIAAHRGLMDMGQKLAPDLCFELGDMVANGAAEHWFRFLKRVLTASDRSDPGSTLASHVPFHMLVGNHEIHENGTYGAGNLDTAMARFMAVVHNPDNGSANSHWKERYYALRRGVATFIALDTNNTSEDQFDNHRYLRDGSTPDWEPGSEQYTWMIEELEKAGTNSVFTFVLMHPSAYSRGVHGSMLDAQSGYPLRMLSGVFRRYEVDAVFSSHDHVVERIMTAPDDIEGDLDPGDPRVLNWLVQGNGGHSTRHPAKWWRLWFNGVDDDKLKSDRVVYYDWEKDNPHRVEPAYFYDWGGTDLASLLDVVVERIDDSRWRASFRTLRSDGKVFDEFAIERAVPRQMRIDR